MSEAARAKALVSELGGLSEVWASKVAEVHRLIDAVDARAERAEALVGWMRTRLYDMQAAPHLMSTILTELLADPECQRVVEQWQALEALRVAAVRLLADLDGDVTYGLDDEPAIAPLSAAIVQNFRASVERSRQP